MRQRGVVSLITAIMVSILLISVSLGLLLLANGGTQQASDDELSLRAYATANGGIEWAYAQILNDINQNLALPNYSNCGQANGTDATISQLFNAANQNAITCMTVTSQANALSGTLGKDEAAQVTVDPQNVPPVSNIVVSWLDQSKTPTEAFPSGLYNKYGLINQNLPAGNTAGLIPGVELTIVNYYTSAAGDQVVPSQGYSIRNVVLLPQSGGETSSGPTPQNPNKILVQCAPNPSGFACTNSTKIPADPAHPAGLAPKGNPFPEGMIVYIRPLFPTFGFHYNVCIELTNNTCLTLSLQEMTLDVTARSGPVYRRIVAKASTGQGKVPAGLNYVLYGDRNVCKDFEIHQAPGATAGNLVCGYP